MACASKERVKARISLKICLTLTLRSKACSKKGKKMGNHFEKKRVNNVAFTSQKKTRKKCLQIKSLASCIHIETKPAPSLSVQMRVYIEIFNYVCKVGASFHLIMWTVFLLHSHLG